MPQLFHPSVNTIARMSIVAVVLAVPAISVATYGYNMTYGLDLNEPIPQPVQFSHKHHVTDDGIDCRYCHHSVDQAGFAGMPSTETCMTCHSQIWADSPLLAPVRESFRTGVPIAWNRVYDLPDFTYFNHSIHIEKGVGCVSCHGQIDQMPLTFKAKTHSMAWCVDCHRNPERHIRPRERIYDMDWEPLKPEERATVREDSKLAARLVKVGKDEYHLLSSFQLTNCSICHR